MAKIYTRRDGETLDDVINRIVSENSYSPSEAAAMEAAILEAIGRRKVVKDIADDGDTPESVAKALNALIRVLSAAGVRILATDKSVLEHDRVQTRLDVLAEAANAIARTCKMHLVKN